MTKAISTTTTKHPHLSIVQLFKEPPHRVQQRSEIMNSSLAAVKHFVSLFNRRPGTTPEQRPQNTRLASTSTTTPAFTENRRSAEEGRIIEIQLPASTHESRKILMRPSATLPKATARRPSWPAARRQHTSAVSKRTDRSLGQSVRTGAPLSNAA